MNALNESNQSLTPEAPTTRGIRAIDNLRQLTEEMRSAVSLVETDWSRPDLSGPMVRDVLEQTVENWRAFFCSFSLLEACVGGREMIKRSHPAYRHRIVRGVFSLAVALLGVVAGQALASPPLAAQAEGRVDPVAESPAKPPAPEYDPGAHQHFLLPTGRLAPQGTGFAGAATAALPVAGFPYVSFSPLPRTSFRASTFLAFDGVRPPSGLFLSATAQPVASDNLNVSVTVLGRIRGADSYTPDIRAGLASLSLGDDVKRFTFATGAFDAGGSPSTVMAFGWDVQLDSREPEIVEIAGRRRTTRTRIKAIGELWVVGPGKHDFTIGAAGVRLSGKRLVLDLVVPFGLDGGVPMFAPVPLVNLSVPL